MVQLYKLADDFARLADEDLPPEMIADTLEGMQGEFEDKLEGILQFIKNEAALSAALKEEEEKLSTRRKSAENRISRLKEYVATCMEKAELINVRAGLQEVSVRKASRTVEILDINAIPGDYVDYETITKPDKLAIKKQLEAGVDIPGVTLKTNKPGLIIK